MFAAVTSSFFVTGEINKRSITTQATTADSTIELSSFAGFANTNVTASSTDFDAPANSLDGNSLASNQCTGQRDCFADKIWAGAFHCIIPKIRPELKSRHHRRVP